MQPNWDGVAGLAEVTSYAHHDILLLDFQSSNWAQFMLVVVLSRFLLSPEPVVQLASVSI